MMSQVPYVPCLSRWKLQLQSACSACLDNDNSAHKAWVEVVPDVWERLPHFQDNISLISIPDDEDHMIEIHAIKSASDEIWLDDDKSMESEPEMSKTTTRWDSFEDLVGEDGDATDLSATYGQAEADDSQPSLVSILPSKYRLS